MSNPRLRFTLSAIGVSVGVTFEGAAAERAALAAHAAWGGLATARRAGHQVHSELSITVARDDEIESTLDNLSTRVTLAAIEHHAGNLLMLHAAGLAHPHTGVVVACVAPSGTGKTTLSAAAAGYLEYVTDETVAVAHDKRVIAYPKPLSITQHEAGRPKVQRQPTELGLRVATGDGLRLGSIVLLNRVSGDGDSAVEAHLRSVAIVDAVMALTPELSYLGQMQHPLRRIISLIDAVGGVSRLTYGEATDAIPLLLDLVAQPNPAASDTSSLLSASDAEVALWEETIASVLEEGTDAAESTVQGLDEGAADEAPLRLAHPLIDLVIDVERGQCLVFSGSRVCLVSQVGAATLLAAQHDLRPRQLDAVLSPLFGSAPRSDSVRAVTQELVEAGLLRAPN